MIEQMKAFLLLPPMYTYPKIKNMLELMNVLGQQSFMSRDKKQL